MANYNTEQKKILLNFLARNCENSYTIEEIVAALAAENPEKMPAKSTVYRLMNKLVEEKLVHRSAGERGRQFVYRSTPAEDCRHHLHLQCVECGKVLHLDRDTSNALLCEVRAARGFNVSESDTVLLGRCALCSDGGKNE